MSLRKEISTHSERTWILVLAEDTISTNGSPLISNIDWYNNFLLTRSVQDGKIPLYPGAQSLLSTRSIFQAQRLVVFGAGNEDDFKSAQAKRLASDISATLEKMDVKNPWIVFAKNISEDFVAAFDKSRTSLPSIAKATMTIG